MPWRGKPRQSQKGGDKETHDAPVTGTCPVQLIYLKIRDKMTTVA